MNFLEKKEKILSSNEFLNFVNSNIKNGLKNQNLKNTFSLMRNIKEEKNVSPVNIMKKGFANLRLLVYIYKRKYGSKLVIIPLYWNDFKKLKKGFSLFYRQVKKGAENTYLKRFINEFNDVLLNKGKAIKARNDIYLIAASNKYNIRFAVNSKLEKERKEALEKEQKSKKVKLLNLNDTVEYINSFKVDKKQFSSKFYRPKMNRNKTKKTTNSFGFE